MTAGANAGMSGFLREIATLSPLLEGLRILLLEDEFLIAMDVEHQCRDHGASDVQIISNLGSVDVEAALANADAAIVDVMLGGVPTLDVAGQMKARGIPFVFASGYTDLKAIAVAFPEVQVVGKPYAGDELVRAVAAACGRI